MKKRKKKMGTGKKVLIVGGVAAVVLFGLPVLFNQLLGRPHPQMPLEEGYVGPLQRQFTPGTPSVARMTNPLGVLG